MSSEIQSFPEEINGNFLTLFKFALGIMHALFAIGLGLIWVAFFQDVLESVSIYGLSGFWMMVVVTIVSSLFYSVLTGALTAAAAAHDELLRINKHLSVTNEKLDLLAEILISKGSQATHISQIVTADNPPWRRGQ